MSNFLRAQTLRHAAKRHHALEDRRAPVLFADAHQFGNQRFYIVDRHQLAQQRLAADPALADALAPISWYPAVPLPVQRVAGIERAQMLLESPARGALQRVLAAGQPLLHALRADPAHRAIVRWAIDVDPLAM